MSPVAVFFFSPFIKKMVYLLLVLLYGNPLFLNQNIKKRWIWRYDDKRGELKMCDLHDYDDADDYLI